MLVCSARIVPDPGRINEISSPDDLLTRLQRSYQQVADAVIRYGGMIIHHLGERTLATFDRQTMMDAGLPGASPELSAVQCALDLQEPIRMGQRSPLDAGESFFLLWTAINYGVVQYVELGSDQHRSLQIFGDVAGLPSGLVELCGKYEQRLLLPERLYRRIKDSIPCRLVDHIRAPGMTRRLAIFTAAWSLSPEKKKAWGYYHAGINRYLRGQLVEAQRHFMETQKLIPGDRLSDLYLERCRARNTPSNS